MDKYIFNYSGCCFEFEKEEDRDKYVVFACAKNEDDYILEWVNHYLNLGFDKIILADNNDDPEKLKSILSGFIKEKRVQIFPCNGLKKFQLYIYNMFLAEGNYKWCAYFDCDEFLELNKHKDIKSFLNEINEDCVLINWVVFGSNGKIYKEDGYVQRRFKLPVSQINFFKENFYVKPIIRGGSNGFYLENTHCPCFTDNRRINIGGYFLTDYHSHVFYPPRLKYAYIKHYYTKSFEEWVSNKVSRGWPDEMFDVLKPANYFISCTTPKFETEKYVNGFFVDNNLFKKEELLKAYTDILNAYDVIVFHSSNNNMYSLTIHLFSFMSVCTEHIFILFNKNVDDAFFNNVLEYGFVTGNKVCYAENDWEVSEIIENKGNNKFGYYSIDCR